MAKGLFTVYRDDAAGLAPPPAPSTSRGASTNKLAVAPQRRQFDGLGQREKENMDPSFMVRKGAPLGKGKAALGKSAKSSGVGGSTCAPPRVRRGFGAAGPQAQKLATKRTTTTPASTNGICTGTLRTRVLPDLPPLPAAAATADSTPAAAATATRSSTRQPIRREPSSVLPAPGSAESSPRSSCDQSYASATDSGYAQSPGALLLPVHQYDGEQVGCNNDDDNKLEARAEGMFADEMDSDMSLASVEEEEEVAVMFDANRRARALTESPLAEVTQAFTGLGGFSVANMSPSPAVHHHHHSAAAPSSQRPSLLSHPTSPTRQNLSLVGMSGGGPAGLRTFTGTTKRLKPGQTVPSAPKAAPGRTMRL